MPQEFIAEGAHTGRRGRDVPDGAEGRVQSVCGPVDSLVEVGEEHLGKASTKAYAPTAPAAHQVTRSASPAESHGRAAPGHEAARVAAPSAGRTWNSMP